LIHVHEKILRWTLHIPISAAPSVKRDPVRCGRRASTGGDRQTAEQRPRDICMCAFFQHRPLSDLRVSEAMSKQVKACKASDAPSIAEKIMSDGRIRRLPVVDERDALVGMISLADLAREA
jgi:CBS domain-containing protein